MHYLMNVNKNSYIILLLNQGVYEKIFKMIDLFIEQIMKEPDKDTILKTKLEIIDWIGYALAGTKTKQATPFCKLQQSLPEGHSLNLFGKRKLNVFDSIFISMPGPAPGASSQPSSRFN